MPALLPELALGPREVERQRGLADGRSGVLDVGRRAMLALWHALAVYWRRNYRGPRGFQVVPQGVQALSSCNTWLVSTSRPIMSLWEPSSPMEQAGEVLEGEPCPPPLVLPRARAAGLTPE